MSTEQSPKYFFSYSKVDAEFALKLAKELRAAGANLWIDRLDIVGGERWDVAIEAALDSCEGMLAVLTPESTSSINVMDEVSYALEEGKHVVPVLHKECKIPFRLRRVQYIDFTASYDRGLAALLKALKIERPAVVQPPIRDRADSRREAAEKGAKSEGEWPTKADHVEANIEDASRKAAAEPGRRPKEGEHEARQGMLEWSQRKIGSLWTAVTPAAVGQGRIKAALVGGGALFLSMTVMACLTPAAEEAPFKSCLLVAGIYGLIPGAITGFICGSNRRIIRSAIWTALIGWLVGVAASALWIWLDPALNLRNELSVPIVGGLTWGVPLGALAGAILAAIRKNRQDDPNS